MTEQNLGPVVVSRGLSKITEASGCEIPTVLIGPVLYQQTQQPWWTPVCEIQQPKTKKKENVEWRDRDYNIYLKSKEDDEVMPAVSTQPTPT